MNDLTKVIFLDIDGVLVTYAEIRREEIYTSGTGRPEHRFNPSCVESLNKITDETGASIVISSSWRKLHTLKELQTLLALRGVTAPVISMTESLGTSVRGWEIQAWIDKQPVRPGFCILDDDADMDHLMDRLILTSLARGLEGSHVDRAIAMLNGDPQ